MLALVKVDSTIVVIDLVVAVLAAVLAYRAALRYRDRFGTTPWHLPAAIWSVLFFLSVVVGLVLFLIARATTRPRNAGARPGTDFAPAPAFPPAPDFGQSGPPPALLPPAGWYPDPSGRHEQRYWDGKGWTGHVSSGGVRSEEPLPH